MEIRLIQLKALWSKPHLHQLERKPFMKNAVDLCTTRQIGRIHLISRSLNAFLKVHPELLDHPVNISRRRCSPEEPLISMTPHTAYVLSTDWRRALVLRAGSSGRKFLNSSTSFSRDNNWLCSLLRNPGKVSRMWLVSCWQKTKLHSYTLLQSKWVGCLWGILLNPNKNHITVKL